MSKDGAAETDGKSRFSRSTLRKDGVVRIIPDVSNKKETYAFISSRLVLTPLLDSCLEELGAIAATAAATTTAADGAGPRTGNTTVATAPTDGAAAGTAAPGAMQRIVQFSPTVEDVREHAQKRELWLKEVPDVRIRLCLSFLVA